MKAYDPLKIRPRRDWVIALAEPRRARVGLIILTEEETGIEKVTEGVCRIIRVGPGKMNEAMGLKAGMRVAYRSYLRFANHITCRQYWRSDEVPWIGDLALVKEHFFLASNDIICEVEEGVDIGVFSRPENQVTDKKVK